MEFSLPSASSSVVACALVTRLLFPPYILSSVVNSSLYFPAAGTPTVNSCSIPAKFATTSIISCSLSAFLTKESIHLSLEIQLIHSNPSGSVSFLYKAGLFLYRKFRSFTSFEIPLCSGYCKSPHSVCLVSSNSLYSAISCPINRSFFPGCVII